MIPIENLLANLRALGVRLWKEQQNLRYSAPKGVLSSSLLADILDRKEEILDFLIRAERSASNHEPSLRPVERSGVAPQSPAQTRLWFLYNLNGPDAAYNVVAQYRLQGNLNRAAFEASICALVQRHEILRTTFGTQDGEPIQLIAPEGNIRILFIDRAEVDAQSIAQQESEHLFNLMTGPLLRVTLIRCAIDAHFLLFTLHHIICDGWSLGILFRELSSIYEAFCQGLPSPLPAPALQYADFAVWQRETLQRDAQARKAFWKKQLEGAPPSLDLLPNAHRRESPSSRGAVEQLHIGQGATEKLIQLCRLCNATPFAGIVAVFSILLARYSGRQDIVIGTQVANRNRDELEALPGFFVNTLPLRIQVDEELSFNQLLLQVRDVTLAALSHQDLPFEKIVDELRSERRIDRNPLVQIMLLWQNTTLEAPSLFGLEVQPWLGSHRSTAKFDLTLEMGKGGNGLEGLLEYNLDLFPPSLIRRMSRQLRRIVELVTAQPARKLLNLALTHEAETSTLLNWSQGDPLDSDTWPSLAAAFEEQVRRTPNSIALTFGQAQLTYSELNRRANQVAWRLIRLGSGPDRLVAVCLPSSSDLIIAILGILKSGAAYLPLDANHPESRLKAVLDDAEPLAIITDSASQQNLPFTGINLVLLDQTQRADNPPNGAHPDTLAYVIYTSGSTGAPKGVMIPHRGVLNLTRWLGEEIYGAHLTPLQIALIAAPVFDASVQQIFGCLLHGHTLHPVPNEVRRDGIALKHFFQSERIDASDCTPSLLSIMLEAGIASDEKLPLRKLLVGGEALAHQSVEEFFRQDRSQRITLINVYGPTECCVDTTALTLIRTSQYRQTVSIGRPLPNTRVYVLDKFGHLAPIGVAGEICIGGDGVGRGYFKRPALTAASFVPNSFGEGERLYRTGDQGFWNEDGFLEFLGRNDDQVKVRGYRIQLSDIESHLLTNTRIRQAAVTVRPDKNGANELIAFVAAEKTLSIPEIRYFLLQRLPDYMVPARYIIADALPLNGNGKLDRKRLPNLEISPTAPVVDLYIAPRSTVEQTLAKVWQNVLNIKRIGIHDNYLALGGDSIKALRVAARLREANLKMEIRDLFLHPTVEDLAPHVSTLRAAPLERSPEDALGETDLSPIQSRFLCEFNGRLAHFNQTLLLSFNRTLNEDSLRAALESVHDHHHVLRATYFQEGGLWKQLIHPARRSVLFDIVDLRSQSDVPRDLRLHASAIQAGFDLGSGPLFKAVLYRLPQGERLLLVAHHLVVDAVSWRIILEDLQHAYTQAEKNQTIGLPRATGFKHWTELLTEYAHSRAQEEKSYWNSLLRSVESASAKSVICTNQECGLHTFRLSHASTEGLLVHAHAAYSTDVNDILLAALARAFYEWTGRSQLVIMLEGHGRDGLSEDVDISRTVGWFTTLFPAVLEGSDSDPGKTIKTVKETLRSVPHKGIGYGALRYITKALNMPLQAPIAFNYLGQVRKSEDLSFFSPAAEDIGPMSDPTAEFPYEVEINSTVIDGVFEFRFAFDSNLHNDSSIIRFAHLYETQLQTLVDHATRTVKELTPSDIDYDGFNLDELEAFVANLPN